MSEIKTIEQAADEAYPDIMGISQGSYRTAYINGAKHQKELSDAREKLLLDVISELRAGFEKIQLCDFREETYDVAIDYMLKADSTLSSVTKKLEGL